VHAAIEDMFDATSVGEIELKGFHQPVPAFAVTAAKVTA
jgi:class 3 adenylate cyclase